jgi:hypothetical protein
MLLGDLLAQVERAGASGNAAALIDDLPLLAQVAAVAAEEGSDPDSYILFAVRRHTLHFAAALARYLEAQSPPVSHRSSFS